MEGYYRIKQYNMSKWRFLHYIWQKLTILHDIYKH